MYIQINIGRNIDNDPMSDTQWERFQNQVIGALINNGKPRYVRDSLGTVSKLRSFYPEDMPLNLNYGEGFYNGYPEESLYVSTEWEPGFSLDLLHQELAELRDEFCQDSIALITASELI